MSHCNLGNLNRYLFYFSYIGTSFSGVARQTKELTVTNVIEDCINQKLSQFCELKSPLYISSRTDRGVHAISNTGHFDLAINGKYFEKELEDQNYKKIFSDILFHINSQLIKYKYPVRMLRIQKVKPDFVCRHAKARTYFYRLGLLENGKETLKAFDDFQRVESALNPTGNVYSGPSSHFSVNNFISSLEKPFITEIREPFDYDMFVKALSLFNGQHNFSAFTNVAGREEMIKTKKNPIKTVKIGISKDRTQFLENHIHKYQEKIKIIEVEVTAGSFLYKMIRKMVGTAVNVANGRIPLSQIEKMFLCPPDFYGYEDSTTILNPNGLFLKQVHYDPKYLEE